MPPLKLSIDVSSRRAGQEQWRESLSGEAPRVKSGDAARQVLMGEKPSIWSGACVYCGSVEQLTSEHIVPLALGGIRQIDDGSCEICRQKTQRFEGLVLLGEMRNARLLQGLASRSGYKGASKNVTVEVATHEGVETRVMRIEDAPVFLSFPLFPEPNFLAAELRLAGLAQVYFGPEPEALMKEHGAIGMTVTGARNPPVAYAQMIAKIAYCFAWAEGVLEYVDQPAELVTAFLESPESLGRFVGTLPEPYESFAGICHRMQISWRASGVLCVEVQLFANAGAPTYVVLLGACTLRGWRSVRASLSHSRGRRPTPND